METSTTGVVILAAGRSTRMQFPKALLPIDDNTFLNTLLMRYLGWGCEEVVIVLSEDLAKQYVCPEDLKKLITIIINDHLEFERFYSVKLGLQSITTSDFCFIQNVDNPFITEKILDKIYQEKSDDEWVSPRYNDKGGHPVLLNRKIIDHIINYPVNDANLNDVLAKWPCKKVEMPDSDILININKPGDFDKLKNGGTK